MSAAEVRVRAYSPGRFPVLVIELPGGELRTVYFETGYDLADAKEVGEDWLRDNAIGRHSFVEPDPSPEIAASSLKAYVSRELLGGS